MFIKITPAQNMLYLGFFSPRMFSHNKTAPEAFPFCGALITRIAEFQRFLA